MIGAMVLTLGISACGADEPQSVGLTGVVYNYSDDTLVAVYVNGHDVGSMDSALPGQVRSGGYICCFSLAQGAKEAQIRVRLTKGKTYETTATIENWWPDLAHYGVVHILPGRKVVMQVTPSAPLPRKDLLEAQQRALGMPVTVQFQMWSAGPRERIDGKE